MTTRKRAHISLHGPAEEDSDPSGSELGYDSEEHESKAARIPKRRRLSPGDEDEDSDSASPAPDSAGEEAGSPSPEPIEDEDEDAEGEEEEQGRSTSADGPEATRRPRPSASAPRKKKLKTGIIYLPRLPPFLKPGALRTLLTPYARHGVSRLFLTPEPAAQRAQRLRGGGNKKHLYTDGWVEFASKTDAKTVVDACNGRTVGGKKGGYYRDDVWSMRYLRGFKWGDLVGERRDEEAERAGRLEAERRKGRREIALFLGNVQRAKVAETRRRKEDARREREPGVGADGDGVEGGRFLTFRQNEVKRKAVVEGQMLRAKPDEDVQRVLSKIF